MAKREVQVRKHIAAAPDVVWSVARDFCGNWHPFLEWVKAERDGSAAMVRVFKAKGEEGLYRERLSYFSDADRELHYCHVEGIKDVVSYEASFHVHADGTGSTVEWRAALEAPEPRAGEIAQGTEAVFHAGIDALESVTSVRESIVDGVPALALSHSGGRSGPLVLFLHGIGGNRGNWRRQLAAVGTTHQAAALDFRGYGGSALGTKQSRVGDHCADILRVMDHFKRSKVILCGLSLGSWIATSFAMRHPDKLSGLILSGGCTGMSEAPQAERAAFLASRQKPLDAGQSPADFADGVVKVIAGPHASADVMRELTESMAAIPAATYRDALWCFTHPEERFDFAKITCPVLMMTGEYDRLASPMEIRGVAKRIHDCSGKPDVRFEVIPRAGHLCNIENATAYNDHLRHFLGRLAP